MKDAELALESDAGSLLPGELEHKRMHAKLDAFDRLGGEVLFSTQLQATVDDRVDDDAAGERLVAVVGELPGLPESAGDLAIIARGREHVGEAASSLDSLEGAGEILPREQCCNHAVARRQARMQRLAH